MTNSLLMTKMLSSSEKTFRWMKILRQKGYIKVFFWVRIGSANAETLKILITRTDVKDRELAIQMKAKVSARVKFKNSLKMKK